MWPEGRGLEKVRFIAAGAFQHLLLAIHSCNTGLNSSSKLLTAGWIPSSRLNRVLFGLCIIPDIHSWYSSVSWKVMSRKRRHLLWSYCEWSKYDHSICLRYTYTAMTHNTFLSFSWVHQWWWYLFSINSNFLWIFFIWYQIWISWSCFVLTYW